MSYRHFKHKYSHYLKYYIQLSFIIFCTFFVIFYTFLGNDSDFLHHPHMKYLEQLRKSSRNNSECLVPKIDPWDSSILSYYSKPDPLICEKKQIQAVKSFKNGIISFDSKVIRGMKCSKTTIYHNEGVSDLEVKYGPTNEFDFSKSSDFSFPVHDEIFEINCNLNNFLKTNTFKYHYAQIIPRKKNLNGRLIEKSSADFPSVIMIGLDSMSRSNFIRQLPNTYNYIIQNEFIDMSGHMKIHDNTYGNILAILTGKRGVSVKEFKAEVNEDWHINFDDFDMIWKDFSENGYSTLFAEDRPDIGTFTYKNLMEGFLHQPTDHYLRPFWICAFWSMLSRRSTASCYDLKPQHQIHFDYLEQFVQKYHEKRKFAFWWTQDMSHGFLNLIGRVDEDFEGFLKSNEKFLDDSIVIIFSDHGHRYDKIRETIIGRIESRMPFHAIRIPKTVREKYPWIIENLKENSNKITTQFDVNNVLRKIAKGEIGKKYEQNKGKRSFSYMDPIPKGRNCFDAGIPIDYCPCYSEIPIPKEEAKEAADFFVQQLNQFIQETEDYKDDDRNRNSRMCAPIRIETIEYSSVRLPILSVLNDVKAQDAPLKSFSIQYHIIIKAKVPSQGIFESLMELDLRTNQWSLVGEIDRNNRYGSTSFCVSSPILKKICHCVQKGTDQVRTLLA